MFQHKLRNILFHDFYLPLSSHFPLPPAGPTRRFKDDTVYIDITATVPPYPLEPVCNMRRMISISDVSTVPHLLDALQNLKLDLRSLSHRKSQSTPLCNIYYVHVKFSQHTYFNFNGRHMPESIVLISDVDVRK